MLVAKIAKELLNAARGKVVVVLAWGAWPDMGRGPASEMQTDPLWMDWGRESRVCGLVDSPLAAWPRHRSTSLISSTPAMLLHTPWLLYDMPSLLLVCEGGRRKRKRGVSVWSLRASSTSSSCRVWQLHAHQSKKETPLRRRPMVPRPVEHSCPGRAGVGLAGMYKTLPASAGATGPGGQNLDGAEEGAADRGHEFEWWHGSAAGLRRCSAARSS